MTQMCSMDVGRAKCYINCKYSNNVMRSKFKFSVPQIEYPPGGSSKTGSHVYFLSHVFWEKLLFCQIVLLFDGNVVLKSQ